MSSAYYQDNRRPRRLDGSPLTDGDIEAILADRRSCREVARAFNLSWRQVACIWRKHRQTMVEMGTARLRGRPIRITREALERAVAVGMTRAAIAALCGASVHGVYRAARRYGIKLPRSTARRSQAGGQRQMEQAE